eukprot:scaffold254151_cov31-Tisochrysis_lutea.AAC.1
MPGIRPMNDYGPMIPPQSAMSDKPAERCSGSKGCVACSSGFAQLICSSIEERWVSPTPYVTKAIAACT